MSAQRRSGRVWFAGLAALALVLVGIASGAHLVTGRTASVNRTAASATTTPLLHHARAVDLASHAGHPAASHQLDPTTPPSSDLPDAPVGRPLAVETSARSHAAAQHSDHPGRAPPTV